MCDCYMLKLNLLTIIKNILLATTYIVLSDNREISQVKCKNNVGHLAISK